MRIFLVSNMYPSKDDQLFGVFVKNFKEEMEKLGVEFTLSALIKGKSYSSSKKLIRYIRHYLKVFWLFFSRNYDLLYVHYLSHHIPILVLILPFKNRPVVVNVHGSDINLALTNSRVRYWARIILKRIDRLVVPTPQFKELVLEKFPFMNDEEILVSPSGGIDDKLFFPLDRPVQHQELKMGFISRLTEEKGWKTFLEALVSLKLENIKFKAVIVGKGPDEELLVSKINENDLNDSVDFIGFVPQTKLREVYASLDLYIFPTFRDSLGLTGLEAMSCGVPVVASNIEGGPSTYVAHGSNGFLFTPRDSQDLKRSILKYYELSKEKKEELSANALSSAKKYQRSEVAKELYSGLKELNNSR